MGKFIASSNKQKPKKPTTNQIKHPSNPKRKQNNPAKAIQAGVHLSAQALTLH